MSQRYNPVEGAQNDHTHRPYRDLSASVINRYERPANRARHVVRIVFALAPRVELAPSPTPSLRFLLLPKSAGTVPRCYQSRQLLASPPTLVGPVNWLQATLISFDRDLQVFTISARPWMVAAEPHGSAKPPLPRRPISTADRAVRRPCGVPVHSATLGDWRNTMLRTDTHTQTTAANSTSFANVRIATHGLIRGQLGSEVLTSGCCNQNPVLSPLCACA